MQFSLVSSPALKMLTITSKDKPGEPEFEVQFNPTSYKHTYQSTFQQRQGVAHFGATPKYMMSPPEVVHFTFILQRELGSGGFLFLLSKEAESVDKRVKAFLKLAYDQVSELHAPHTLVLSWGPMKFTGVMESANINYTAFDNNGVPIRAEIDASFRGAMDDAEKSKSNSSPDLTHARTVKDWQTLPMMTTEIYGDGHLYLLVAEANGLDHFRALKPGTKLHFPPTEKDASVAAQDA